MFRKHSPQMSLFQPPFWMNKRLLRELESSWAHIFRHKVFPRIPEDVFADLYCEGRGAPNFPVRLLVALCLFKELLGLRDVDLVANFHFNALFHYALWIAPGDYTLSIRTLAAPDPGWPVWSSVWFSPRSDPAPRYCESLEGKEKRVEDHDDRTKSVPSRGIQKQKDPGTKSEDGQDCTKRRNDQIPHDVTSKSWRSSQRPQQHTQMLLHQRRSTPR